MNSLFDAMMRNSQFGGMQNLIMQYKQFRNTFQGDPHQKIQEMLNNGQITQQQVNQAQNMAEQFKGLLR